MSVNTNNPLDAIISKSLDEIDSLVKGIKEGNTDLSKGMNDEDPNDVSEDAPEDTEDNDGGEGNPDNVDEDADNEGAEDQTDEQDEDAEKSLESTLNSNDSVRKALEVSEFLGELVKGISTVIEGQRKDINKSLGHSETLLGAFGKTFEGLAKSQKAVLETQAEVLKSIRALGKRMSSIEAQPVARKSQATAKAQVINKSFEASIGNQPSAGNQLSKSEVLSKLNAEFAKGNMNAGQDILRYEATGNINDISVNTRSLINL